MKQSENLSHNHTQIPVFRDSASGPAARTLSRPAAVILVTVAVLASLTVGLQREMLSRYPASDLPKVDMEHIERQIEKGNVSRREALFYRKIYAGADSTEIR